MGRQSSKHAGQCREYCSCKVAGHAILLPNPCAPKQVERQCSIMHYTVVSAMCSCMFVKPYNVFAADIGVLQGSMYQSKVMRRALQRNVVPRTYGSALQTEDKDESRDEATCVTVLPTTQDHQALSDTASARLACVPAMPHQHVNAISQWKATTDTPARKSPTSPVTSSLWVFAKFSMLLRVCMLLSVSSIC